MARKLLILDGSSDVGGPNVTEQGARRHVPKSLFAEIQRLEFTSVAALIGSLPYLTADAVLHVGHGGADGPNARGSDDKGIWMATEVTKQRIRVFVRTQDQIATQEVAEYVIEGDAKLALQQHLERRANPGRALSAVVQEEIPVLLEPVDLVERAEHLLERLDSAPKGMDISAREFDELQAAMRSAECAPALFPELFGDLTTAA